MPLDLQKNVGAIYRTPPAVTLAVGAIYEFKGNTRFLVLIAATDRNSLAVSFDGAAFSPWPRGITLYGFEAPRVWIRNDSANPNTVTVATGMADLADTRFSPLATDTIQVIVNAGGTLIGQQLMAASLPVVIASNQSAIPVTTSPASGALTDRSGTIAVGGASQALAAANAARKYLIVQNVSGADLWFNFGVAAVIGQPSFRLVAGATFTMEGAFISTQAVNIIGAAAAQAFAAKEG